MSTKPQILRLEDEFRSGSVEQSLSTTTARHYERERIIDNLENKLAGCGRDISIRAGAWKNGLRDLVDILIGVIDLDMESVSSFLSDLKLQILNVLTVSVACGASKSEVGLAIGISRTKRLEKT